MKSLLLNHCIAFVVLSFLSAIFLLYSEQVQRLTLRIFDIQNVPPGDHRREIVEDDSYILKVRAAGMLFFLGDLLVIWLAFKNDF